MSFQLMRIFFEKEKEFNLHTKNVNALPINVALGQSSKALYFSIMRSADCVPITALCL